MRGFAFVELRDGVDGEAVITEMNGSVMGGYGQPRGRTLNVNEARPKVKRLGTQTARE